MTKSSNNQLRLNLINFFCFRPKSVPNSPSIPRAFSNLRHQLTSAWSGTSKKKQQSGNSAQALSSDDKKKWQSSQDCASKSIGEFSIKIEKNKQSYNMESE